MAVNVTIAEPSSSDIADLVREARAIDRKEWRAMLGRDMEEEGLRKLIRASQNARAVRVDGALVCIFGVQAPTVLSDVGAIWLLATDAVSLPVVRKAFIRSSEAGLRDTVRGFRAVWNAVAIENKVAIRWLRWLGFRFIEGERRVVGGVPFVSFYMEVA